MHRRIHCTQAHALCTGTWPLGTGTCTGNRYGGYVRFLCCKYWSRRKVFTCILVSNLLVVLVSLHKKLQGLLCCSMLHLEWSVVHCTPVQWSGCHSPVSPPPAPPSLPAEKLPLFQLDFHINQLRISFWICAIFCNLRFYLCAPSFACLFVDRPGGSAFIGKPENGQKVVADDQNTKVRLFK